MKGRLRMRVYVRAHARAYVLGSSLPRGGKAAHDFDFEKIKVKKWVYVFKQGTFID